MNETSFERVRTIFENTPPYFNCSTNSRKIRSEISHFSDRAKALANEILISNHRYQSTEFIESPVVIIRSHYWSPWESHCWSPCSRPGLTSNTSSRAQRRDSSNREKKNEGLLLLIGLTAAVVGTVTLFKTLGALPRYYDASQELKETKKFQQELETFTPKVEECALIEEAQHVSDLKARICTRIRNSALIDLALSISLTASSCMAGVGASMLLLDNAMVDYPPILSVGLVASGVLGGLTLINWALDSSDKKNVRDAFVMRDSINRLRTLYV